jgi:hypothetical protein
MKSCMIVAALASVAVAQQQFAPQQQFLPQQQFAGRAFASPYGQRGFASPYGYPLQPRYVERVTEIPRPVPAPAVSSPGKTLAAVDMLLTQLMIGGLAGNNVAQNYILDGGVMQKKTGGSDFMTMMMLSQGLGGTGSNQLAMYNVLNRNNDARYINVGGAASTTVNGVAYAGFAPAPDQGDSIMAMMNGGLGGMGISAGQMLPIFMYGGNSGPFPLNGVDLMQTSLLTSGAW